MIWLWYLVSCVGVVMWILLFVATVRYCRRAESRDLTDDRQKMRDLADRMRRDQPPVYILRRVVSGLVIDVDIAATKEELALCASEGDSYEKLTWERVRWVGRPENAPDTSSVAWKPTRMTCFHNYDQRIEGYCEPCKKAKTRAESLAKSEHSHAWQDYEPCACGELNPLVGTALQAASHSWLPSERKYTSDCWYKSTDYKDWGT